MYEVVSARRCGRASQVRLRDCDSGICWVALVNDVLDVGDMCVRGDNGDFVRLTEKDR